MQIYQVGGAVRDKLLGLPIKDQDWVVVGSSPDLMKAQGFQPVGKDFPVFLHPDTKEEYALARTERKSSHGYGGFTFHTASNVTLEADLLRRDLTINAMAEDESGHIIDPYGGQKDIEQRILRHVSPAFSEDPLRILRIARFAARLTPLGFTIADETLSLMISMVSDGEASYLTAERVWQETRSVMMENNPEVYFQVLKQCGALSVVFPEFDHTQFSSALSFMHKAASINATELVRFGCLFITKDLFENQRDNIHSLSERLHLPSSFTEQAQLIANYTQQLLQLAVKIEAEDLISLFNGTDALRRPRRFHFFLDSLSLAFHEVQCIKPLILQCLEKTLNIRARNVIPDTVKGKAVGAALNKARLDCIKNMIERKNV